MLHTSICIYRTSHCIVISVLYGKILDCDIVPACHDCLTPMPFTINYTSTFHLIQWLRDSLHSFPGVFLTSLSTMVPEWSLFVFVEAFLPVGIAKFAPKLFYADFKTWHFLPEALMIFFFCPFQYISACHGIMHTSISGS